MPKFRKKPIVIEAFQMTKQARGDNRDWPGWLNRAWNEDVGKPGGLWPCDFPKSNGQDELMIGTLEGNHRVSFEDWIIKGVNGELYPCKPDIFEKTYELVEEA